jgi:hypothetical protein
MFIALLIIGIFFIGCNWETQEEKSIGETAMSTGISKTYKQMALLQKSYAQKGVDIVEKYIDIPEESSRSINGALMMWLK